MKKNTRIIAKTKAKTDKHAEIESIVHKTLREEITSKLPPTSELAHIAALLAQGTPIEARNAETLQTLAGQALDLWNDCDLLRAKYFDLCWNDPGMWQRLHESFRRDSLPTPQKYPVSLDDFLKLALPNKRVEDRMRIYRGAVRENIRLGRSCPNEGEAQLPLETIPIPSDDDVAEVICRHRATGLVESEYKIAYFDVRDFSERLKKDNLIKRAQAGAKAKNTKTDAMKNPPK